MLQKKAAVLKGKASLWHVRASNLFFSWVCRQVPVGKGKCGVNARSYKIGETQSVTDLRNQNREKDR